MDTDILSVLTDIVVPALVFMLMLVVGLELKRDDFGAVAKRPRSLIVGGLGQVVVAPSVALAIVAIIQPSGMLAVALVLLAICPSGALSNFFVLINRGNVALSVTLTVLSSLVCIIATPLLALLVFRLIYVPHADFVLPIPTILTQLALFVLLPVVLGMAVRIRFSSHVDAGRPIMMAAAAVFLTAVVAVAVAASWTELMEMICDVAVLACLLTVASLVLGALIARLLVPQDRSACATECAVRNIPVALLLAADFADSAVIVAFAAGYVLVHAPILVGFSLLRSKAG